MIGEYRLINLQFRMFGSRISDLACDMWVDSSFIGWWL